LRAAPDDDAVAYLGGLLNNACSENLHGIAIHREFRHPPGIGFRASLTEALHHPLPPRDGVFVGLRGPGMVHFSHGCDLLDDLLVNALPAQKFRNVAPDIGASAAELSCNCQNVEHFFLPLH